MRACLAQEGGPYEIIFSDDGSDDGTYEAICHAVEGYSGPHQIRVRRNERNLGIGQHYNELIALARGNLLVTAAGDDISYPQRTRRILEAWETCGRTADLIASHVLECDRDGTGLGVVEVDDLSMWRDLHAWAARRPFVIGAAHAFTKRVMQRFGPLSNDIAYEDQILTFRAIASGGCITVPEPLVRYRRGGTSRCPVFPTAQAMLDWSHRRTRRHLGEMKQLRSDARRCDAAELMERHLAGTWERAAYMRLLCEATNARHRLGVLLKTRSLPFHWRLRRALHFLFPHATHLIKQALGMFHKAR